MGGDIVMMKIKGVKSLLLCAIFAAGTMAAAATAAAQGIVPRGRPVYFTFSQPVSLPNLTLQPGRYLFQMLESNAQRTIIQVFTGDRAKLLGTYMTIEALRPSLPEKAELSFLETKGANVSAPAIGMYWYPGDVRGWEFVYPREQATRIAKQSNHSIVTHAANAQGNDMSGKDLVRVGPTGEETAVSAGATAELRDDSVRGEVDANADVPAASVNTNAGQPQPTGQIASATTTRRNELPRTASNVPMLMLIGVALLAGGVALSFGRRAA